LGIFFSDPDGVEEEYNTWLQNITTPAGLNI